MTRSRGPNLALIAYTGLMLMASAGLTSASAQTAVDGRIVRVLIVDALRTHGFHLAHMKDGRYCVHLSGLVRLNLATIERTDAICFAKVPATIRTADRTLGLGSGNRTLYEMVSITAASKNVTLNIAYCRAEKTLPERRCFHKRYVVHMRGEDCSAEITLSRGKAVTSTCEHYAAQ